MDVTIDQLAVELARLKARVEHLEKAAFAPADDYVEGWTRAGKLIGVTEKTCKRRYADGDFPTPCKLTTIARKTGDYDRPTWRRSDLVAYAEGK